MPKDVPDSVLESLKKLLLLPGAMGFRDDFAPKDLLIPKTSLQCWLVRQGLLGCFTMPKSLKAHSYNMESSPTEIQRRALRKPNASTTRKTAPGVLVATSGKLSQPWCEGAPGLGVPISRATEPAVVVVGGYTQCAPSLPYSFGGEVSRYSQGTSVVE